VVGSPCTAIRSCMAYGMPCNYQYLHNVVEQGHRFLQCRVHPGRGLGLCRTARRCQPGNGRGHRRGCGAPPAVRGAGCESTGDATENAPPVQFILYSASWPLYKSSVHRLQNTLSPRGSLGKQPMTRLPQDCLGATRAQRWRVTDVCGRKRPSEAVACQGLLGSAGLPVFLTSSHGDPWSVPWGLHPCTGRTDWWTIRHRVPRSPWQPCAAWHRRPLDTPGRAAA